MNYSVKDNKLNKYLTFVRFVKGEDVISVAEPTDDALAATRFNTKEDAEASISELNNYNMYDTTNCVIVENERNLI